MATDKKTAQKTAPQKAMATKAAGKTKESDTLSAQERAAVRERAKELKAAQKGQDAEQAVLDAIAAMPQPDRGLAERIHAIVKETAPELLPKTWYGMPAYARDGQVICFFKNAAKFGVRYAELGFNEPANLDDGNMWPTVFAVVELTPEVEERIAALVRQAVS